MRYNQGLIFERMLIMGLFSNYEKVGKGVSKDPDNKIALFRFFDIYLNHFSKLILLNLIFLLALLPFAGIMFVEYLNVGNIGFYIIFVLLGVFVGPALCGFMKVLRNISCRRPVFIWADFWKAFRTNFKQGAIMGIIDMLFITAMSFAIPLYWNFAAKNSFFNIPFIICIVTGFIFIMMHFYIYLLIVSTTLNLWQILKNSLYLIAIEIKSSVVNLITTVVIAAAFIVLYPWSVPFLLIIPSFLGLLYAFNCFPAIRNHVIKPYYDARGEKMPEISYTQPDEGGEAVFVDTPETEISQEPPKKKKKRVVR